MDEEQTPYGKHSEVVALSQAKRGSPELQGLAGWTGRTVSDGIYLGTAVSIGLDAAARLRLISGELSA